MTAFLNKEDVRSVEVPDDELKGATDGQMLEKIFHYGQNDFQNQYLQSVSVGDIIKLRDGEYWMVLPTGFKQISLKLFCEISGGIGVKAYMGVYNELP
jgi:hypothetical protein